MVREDRMAIGKHCQTAKEIDSGLSQKLERKLQKEIAGFLSIRDVWFGRAKFGKRSTYTPGAPDFLFAWNGRPYALECKIGDNGPTEGQLEAHCRMRLNGWMVFVVRSLEEVKAILDDNELQKVG